MTATSAHCKTRCQERLGLFSYADLNRAWRTGIPASNDDLCAYGTGRYHGKEYRVCDMSGERVIVVKGKRFVTVLRR